MEGPQQGTDVGARLDEIQKEAVERPLFTSLRQLEEAVNALDQRVETHQQRLLPVSMSASVPSHPEIDSRDREVSAPIVERLIEARERIERITGRIETLDAHELAL